MYSFTSNLLAIIKTGWLGVERARQRKAPRARVGAEPAPVLAEYSPKLMRAQIYRDVLRLIIYQLDVYI